MQNDNKQINLVTAEEHDKVARALRTWLNEWEGLPVVKLDYEYLSSDNAMAISSMQGAYKLKQFIYGGYQAQYQFRIIYRIISSNTNERLQADELLNALASWAETRKDKPYIADNIAVRTIRRDTTAALAARYDDGSEDHIINMNMIYEVM